MSLPLPTAQAKTPADLEEGEKKWLV